MIEIDEATATALVLLAALVQPLLAAAGASTPAASLRAWWRPGGRQRAA